MGLPASIAPSPRPPVRCATRDWPSRVEDRNAGTVVGKLDTATVTASVRTQADSSVRVQFDSRDARDPALIERISRSYDRRMGR